MTYRKPVVSIKGTTIVNTAIQVKVLIVNIDLKATIPQIFADLWSLSAWMVIIIINFQFKLV